MFGGKKAEEREKALEHNEKVQEKIDKLKNKQLHANQKI